MLEIQAVFSPSVVAQSETAQKRPSAWDDAIADILLPSFFHSIGLSKACTTAFFLNFKAYSAHRSTSIYAGLQPSIADQSCKFSCPFSCFFSASDPSQMLIGDTTIHSTRALGLLARGHCIHVVPNSVRSEIFQSLSWYLAQYPNKRPFQSSRHNLYRTLFDSKSHELPFVRSAGRSLCKESKQLMVKSAWNTQDEVLLLCSLKKISSWSFCFLSAGLFRHMTMFFCRFSEGWGFEVNIVYK